MLEGFAGVFKEQYCNIVWGQCTNALSTLFNENLQGSALRTLEDFAVNTCVEAIKECPRTLLYQYPVAALAGAAVVGLTVGCCLNSMCRPRR